MRFNTERLILFEINEASLYAIQMELEQQIAYGKYFVVLAGLRTRDLWIL